MKYPRTIIYLLICILISVLIFGSMSYFNIIDDKTSDILIKIFTLISIIYASYSICKINKKKNNSIGLILGIITVSIFLILSLLFSRITKEKIIYYILIVIASKVGCILYKKHNKK